MPIPRTPFLNLKAKLKVGLNNFSAILIRNGFLSLVFPLKKVAARAGTTVKESSSAEPKAMIKVIAIGPNIFPSTPVRAKSGIKTVITINSPNPAADRISIAESITNCLTSARDNSLPSSLPFFCSL